MRPLSELVPLPSLLPSATPAVPASAASPAAAMPAASIPLAEITSVPASQARQVLSATSLRIATLLTLAPIAGIVSGVGLFILGIAYAHVTQVFTIVCVLAGFADIRSEEHTSELQSQSNLVCRLLLEKKKYK